MLNRLHICQTCLRDARTGDDGMTRGQRLTEHVLAALRNSPLNDRLVIRKVPCLSGCLRPCNVSFRAIGKSSIRFSELDAKDADDVLQFATAYIESANGDVPLDRWPESLRTRMTARTPAPPPPVQGADRH